MTELIVAIVALITLVGSILTIWVKLNIKIKELDMKILEIEHKFDNVKQERQDILSLIEKNNDKIWDKLDQILLKLDDKFTNLAVLQNEHNQMMKNCQKK